MAAPALCFLRSSHRVSVPLVSRSIPARRRRYRRFALSTVSVRAAAGGGAAVVWFKNDLRIDDHPGLVAAAEKHETVVPLYVFDPRILIDYSDEMLELLLFALQGLKTELKSKGSDLLFGFGNTENVVSNLVNEVRASHIFTEEEVEYNQCSVINSVESYFDAKSFSWGTPKFVFWRAPLYDFKSLEELSMNYNSFQRAKLSKATPLSAPDLPALTTELERGNLPTLEEVKRFIKERANQSDERWTNIKKVTAKSVLWKIEETSKLPIIMRNKRIPGSFFASETGIEVRGGTHMVLDALDAYLRYLEGTGRDDWQELHDKLRIAERGNGTSFYTLFGSSIYLGAISRRRIFHEAIKYERDRNAGFLSPFGYSTPTVTAAVNAICSMEWYRLLSLKSQKFNGGNYPIHIWRWNHYLIQYTAVGQVGPAILLVHGFGAFLDHYRDNISDLSKNGNRVWAITLVGFGKSEKPNLSYNELLWAELIRDFLVDVIKEPVHLVGNSLGGYIASIVAGSWPTLVRSLILINTAGKVVPSYSSIPLSEEGRTSFFSQLQAQLLLLYLRSSAANMLKSYYPTKKERVDELLVNEITRASYDPGAVTVLERIFNFNLSIPLNFLLSAFGGRTLVIQGMRDPLIKSNSFLSLLKEHCNNVTIRELDAGHCPHDEAPDEVNMMLSEWTSEIQVK